MEKKEMFKKKYKFIIYKIYNEFQKYRKIL